MRRTRTYWTMLLGVALIWLPAAFASARDPEMAALLEAGMLYRLKGDYAGAKRIGDQLKTQFPDDPAGYTFNVNTLVGRFSWDLNDTQFDAELREDANTALHLCRSVVEVHPQDARGYYVCGQAHFALTYLHAARGNYYRAGTNGSDTIEMLEKALALAPDLVDAKMHLGAAHYFAENLPLFLRAVSGVLWFVPTGDPAKSLPYVEHAARSGHRFRDIAKYMYSTLLLDGDASAQRTAGGILADLVQRYPESRRFQLRYISHLVQRAEYASAVAAVDNFMRDAPCCRRDPMDVELARLWKVRALLGQEEIEGAASEISRIPVEMVSSFPYWGRAWYALTSGQVNDALEQREQAVRDYRRVLALADDGHVSNTLSAIAISGLEHRRVYP